MDWKDGLTATIIVGLGYLGIKSITKEKDEVGISPCIHCGSDDGIARGGAYCIDCGRHPFNHGRPITAKEDDGESDYSDTVFDAESLNAETCVSCETPDWYWAGGLCSVSGELKCIGCCYCDNCNKRFTQELEGGRTSSFSAENSGFNPVVLCKTCGYETTIMGWPRGKNKYTCNCEKMGDIVVICKSCNKETTYNSYKYGYCGCARSKNAESFSTPFGRIVGVEGLLLKYPMQFAVFMRGVPGNYSATCGGCGGYLGEYEKLWFDDENRSAWCPHCMTVFATNFLIAGREDEEVLERRLREKFPRHFKDAESFAAEKGYRNYGGERWDKITRILVRDEKEDLGNGMNRTQALKNIPTNSEVKKWLRVKRTKEWPGNGRHQYYYYWGLINPEWLKARKGAELFNADWLEGKTLKKDGVEKIHDMGEAYYIAYNVIFYHDPKNNEYHMRDDEMEPLEDLMPKAKALEKDGFLVEICEEWLYHPTGEEDEGGDIDYLFAYTTPCGKCDEKMSWRFGSEPIFDEDRKVWLHSSCVEDDTESFSADAQYTGNNPCRQGCTHACAECCGCGAESFSAEIFEARYNQDGTIVLTDSEWGSCLHMTLNSCYLWGNKALLLEDEMKSGNKFKVIETYTDAEVALIHRYERIFRAFNKRKAHHGIPVQKYAESFAAEAFEDGSFTIPCPRCEEMTLTLTEDLGNRQYYTCTECNQDSPMDFSWEREEVLEEALLTMDKEELIWIIMGNREWWPFPFGGRILGKKSMAETHAYSYAYNEGHSDSRKTGEYRPSLSTPKQEASFRRILKQKGD